MFKGFVILWAVLFSVTLIARQSVQQQSQQKQQEQSRRQQKQIIEPTILVDGNQVINHFNH